LLANGADTQGREEHIDYELDKIAIINKTALVINQLPILSSPQPIEGDEPSPPDYWQHCFMPG
jgi:hypothetical protein